MGMVLTITEHRKCVLIVDCFIVCMRSLPSHRSSPSEKGRKETIGGRQRHHFLLIECDLYDTVIL